MTRGDRNLTGSVGLRGGQVKLNEWSGQTMIALWISRWLSAG